MTTVVNKQGDIIHLWDGANIVADIKGNDITVYIRGANLIYADDGEETYYHFNAHGDVVVLTNESGNKTKSYAYNAFIIIIMFKGILTMLTYGICFK